MLCAKNVVERTWKKNWTDIGTFANNKKLPLFKWKDYLKAMESLYLIFKFYILILKLYVQNYDVILKFHLYYLPDFNYLNFNILCSASQAQGNLFIYLQLWYNSSTFYLYVAHSYSGDFCIVSNWQYSLDISHWNKRYLVFIFVVVSHQHLIEIKRLFF